MQGIILQAKKGANLSNAETYRLGKAAHKWDPTIRRMLHRFARRQWPDEHLLGLIPVHRYRLRKQVEPGIYRWWVEHDIPPYDRFQCAAYQVEMILNGPDQPQLILHSGEAVYPVAPLTAEKLADAFARMRADAPLIIHRQFGPALDP
jgi:hypothetical protein